MLTRRQADLLIRYTSWSEFDLQWFGFNILNLGGGLYFSLDDVQERSASPPHEASNDFHLEQFRRVRGFAIVITVHSLLRAAQLLE